MICDGPSRVAKSGGNGTKSQDCKEIVRSSHR